MVRELLWSAAGPRGSGAHEGYRRRVHHSTDTLRCSPLSGQSGGTHPVQPVLCWPLPEPGFPAEIFTFGNPGGTSRFLARKPNGKEMITVPVIGKKNPDLLIFDRQANLT